MQPKLSGPSTAMSEVHQHRVSVVIPTRGRPESLAAAVRSALAQTLAPFEVLVIVDGPETGPSTTTALAAVADSRLRLISLPESVGGAEARNIGVREARGEWIAFLDDDDLWLGEKLAVQLEEAHTVNAAKTAVISCRVIARAPEWEEVWPRTMYRSGQDMGEYLFCRRDWRYGAALLQTSTLFVPRELLVRVPFASGLRKHQDWDWMLRVAAEPDVVVRFAGGLPLSIFHVEGQRASVGRAQDWRFSLDWARSRRPYLTQRAYAGFLAIECTAQAQLAGAREKLLLTGTVLRASRGSFMRSIPQLLVFLWVPQHVRRAMRDRLRHALL